MSSDRHCTGASFLSYTHNILVLSADLLENFEILSSQGTKKNE